MQKFSDPVLDKCPTCGGPISKLVSRTSFQLKGSGWYATDYKATSKAPADSKAEKETKKEEPKSSTSTEKTSKPDSGGKTT